MKEENEMKYKCGRNLVSFLEIFQLLFFPSKSKITQKQVTFLLQSLCGVKCSIDIHQFEVISSGKVLAHLCFTT
jgi:hypothetical protein